MSLRPNRNADFRWNDDNRDHIWKHHVMLEDAEHVVRYAGTPFPEYRGDGKYYVAGQTANGAYLQVIYVLDDDGTIYVIHARYLTDREKRRLRRRRR